MLNSESVEEWIIGQCRGLGPFCNEMCSDAAREPSMDINVKGNPMNSPLGFNSVPMAAREVARDEKVFYTRGPLNSQGEPPQSHWRGPLNSQGEPPQRSAEEGARQNFVPVPQLDLSPYATVPPPNQDRNLQTIVPDFASPRTHPQSFSDFASPRTQVLPTETLNPVDQSGAPSTRPLTPGWPAPPQYQQQAPQTRAPSPGPGPSTLEMMPPRQQDRQHQGPLSSPSYTACVFCASRLSEGANFCRKCGTEQPGGRERLASQDWQATQISQSAASGPVHTRPLQTLGSIEAPRTQLLHTSPLLPAAYATPELPPMQNSEAYPTVVGTMAMQQLVGPQEPMTTPIRTRPLGMPDAVTRAC